MFILSFCPNNLCVEPLTVSYLSSALLYGHLCYICLLQLYIYTHFHSYHVIVFKFYLAPTTAPYSSQLYTIILSSPTSSTLLFSLATHSSSGFPHSAPALTLLLLSRLYALCSARTAFHSKLLLSYCVQLVTCHCVLITIVSNSSLPHCLQLVPLSWCSNNICAQLLTVSNSSLCPGVHIIIVSNSSLFPTPH